MEFTKPRGTRDFLFDEMQERKEAQSILRNIFENYGYREVKTPLFEELKLFTTKSGEEIVDQLYNFKDKSNRELTLRPEITAPIARLYLNELEKTAIKPIKLYYYGSCFRYERPQKGRFRQFWQFGCELIGANSPQGEAEVIALCNDAVNSLGITTPLLPLHPQDGASLPGPEIDLLQALQHHGPQPARFCQSLRRTQRPLQGAGVDDLRRPLRKALRQAFRLGQPLGVQGNVRLALKAITQVPIGLTMPDQHDTPLPRFPRHPATPSEKHRTRPRISIRERKKRKISQKIISRRGFAGSAPRSPRRIERPPTRKRTSGRGLTEPRGTGAAPPRGPCRRRSPTRYGPRSSGPLLQSPRRTPRPPASGRSPESRPQPTARRRSVPAPRAPEPGAPSEDPTP